MVGAVAAVGPDPAAELGVDQHHDLLARGRWPAAGAGSRTAPRRAGRAAAPGCRARRSGCRSRRGTPSRRGWARPARSGWPPCPAGRRAARRRRRRRPCPRSRPCCGSAGRLRRPVAIGRRAERAGGPLQVGQRGGHPGLPRPVGRVGPAELAAAPCPAGPAGSLSPGSGNEAAATFSPASSGGSTDSSDTAASGSVVVASSQRPSQPVVLEVTGRRGLPDGHRPEVAAVGLRVADSADDGELAVVPQRLEPGHARVQAQPLAEVEHLVGPVGQLRAGRPGRPGRPPGPTVFSPSLPP